MSTALTVTVDEVNGKLRFSRILFLGSEYVITWAGLATGAPAPTLALFDCDGNPLCVSTPSTGSFKLNTIELISLWGTDVRKAQSVHAYVYADSVILGEKAIPVMWSPLTFDVSPDPVSILGIAAYWDAHVNNTANPHNVTLSQVGGAAAVHTHDYTGVRFLFDDDVTRVQHPTLVNGQPTTYWEDV